MTHIPRLDRWLQWRELSQNDVTEQFEIVGNGIQPNSRYYNFTDVTKVQTKEGNFFFQDDEFGLLYLSEGILNRDPAISIADLETALGKAEHKLPSRAGKPNRQHIYPEIGIAFSAVAGKLDFMEIFQPTDIETYKATFYKAPLSRR